MKFNGQKHCESVAVCWQHVYNCQSCVLLAHYVSQKSQLQSNLSAGTKAEKLTGLEFEVQTCLQSEKILINLFVKYNTAISSSATV